MKRRDFLRRTIGASVASGALLSMGEYGSVFGAESKYSNLPYDLVAVKNGSAVAMFDKGIAELGGMKAFVKPNQTVVIKPNIGWDSAPEQAANTNPDLVGRIVEHCIQAGAKKVLVFDNTCDEWTRCYKNSGIEKAVNDAGGQMVTGKTEGHYQALTVTKGKVLKNTKVHELILESDVFINVPVLKSHGGAKLSLSMKNLMGIVWDRRFYHQNDLHQCIADFASIKQPDLNIIDGFRVLKRNGPRGVSVDDVAEMKYQLIGTDMVALDTAAAKVFGMDISLIKHLGYAQELGVGTTNLESLKIKRLSL